VFQNERNLYDEGLRGLLGGLQMMRDFPSGGSTGSRALRQRDCTLNMANAATAAVLGVLPAPPPPRSPSHSAAAALTPSARPGTLLSLCASLCGAQQRPVEEELRSHPVSEDNAVEKEMKAWVAANQPGMNASSSG
jgi:hypothetical protein